MKVDIFLNDLLYFVRPIASQSFKNSFYETTLILKNMYASITISRYLQKTSTD